MTVTRGRVLKGAGAEARPVASHPRAPQGARGRVVSKVVVQAEAKAQKIVADAERRAEQIIRASEREAAGVRLRAEAEGRADGAASIAAQALALATQEARADQRQLDRSVELAVLLAERLLGETLVVEPERIVALARQALREARSAHQVSIVAHPEDAAILQRSFQTLGVPPEAARIQPDPERERGNLRLETEASILDAELAPQLERLALKLRDSLDS